MAKHWIPNPALTSSILVTTCQDNRISGSGGMVDTLVLGTSTSVCRFESCFPYQSGIGSLKQISLAWLARYLATFWSCNIKVLYSAVHGEKAGQYRS